MKMIYVAGPYRADSKPEMMFNVTRAWAYARLLWAAGHAVICPHANTFEMQGVGVSVETILEGDFEMVRRSDEIHVLPGWEGSAGTKAEIAVARAHGIPVIYVPTVDLVHKDLPAL
jgi:nucleoside 2-deoxyribosyltransferase